MTKDDVMQVLRLIAMGRVGHPLQEEFAEKLAAVFAGGTFKRVEPLPLVGAESVSLPTDGATAWNGPRNPDGSCAPCGSTSAQSLPPAAGSTRVLAGLPLTGDAAAAVAPPATTKKKAR